jgi:hypothetical protein
MVLHYDFEPRKLLLSAQRAARRGFFTYATLQKLWLPLFQTRAFPPPEELPEFHSEMTVMKKSFDQQQYPSKREYLEALRDRYSEEGRY